MSTTRTIFFGLILSIATSFFLVSNSFTATTSTTSTPINSITNSSLASEVKLILQKPILRINIPGVNFSDVTKMKTTDGEVYLNVPFLGEYISSVYKYLVLVSAIIAVAMLIFAGVQRMLPSEDAQKKSQDRMLKIAIGLILILISYTLLYTINPELVQLRDLAIRVANPEDYFPEDGHGTETHEEAKTPGEKTAAARKKYCPNYNWDSSKSEGINRQNCMIECGKNLPPNKQSTATSKAGELGINTKIIDRHELDCHANAWSRSINTIALHDHGASSVGSAGGDVAHWRSRIFNGKIPLGTHYVVQDDGTILQLLDERFAVAQGVNSGTAIAIELHPSCAGGSTKCTYSPKLVSSLQKLVSYLRTKYKNPRIIGHCEKNKLSDPKAHTDPRMFNWEWLGQSNNAHHVGKCKYKYGVGEVNPPNTKLIKEAEKFNKSSGDSFDKICCEYNNVTQKTMNKENEPVCFTSGGIPKSGACPK